MVWRNIEKVFFLKRFFCKNRNVSQISPPLFNSNGRTLERGASLHVNSGIMLILLKFYMLVYGVEQAHHSRRLSMCDVERRFSPYFLPVKTLILKT